MVMYYLDRLIFIPLLAIELATADQSMPDPAPIDALLLAGNTGAAPSVFNPVADAVIGSGELLFI